MNMEIQKFIPTTNKICNRCVMDDSAIGISFDKDGVCNFCKIHDELEMQYAFGAKSSRDLNGILEKIKKDGKGKKYDCIVGVSGGRDSTYTLYSAVKFGLRPLAVHFDNGWNTEVAVKNIKNVCQKLNVDLFTYVADWEEFKDLQRSFLKASVSDADVPNDWTIFSVLFQAAAKEGLRYIVHGHSFRTEGSSPLSWTYMDGKYLMDIQKKFGTRKIKSFPIMTISDFIYYSFIKNIRQIRLLYFLPYDEKEILKVLNTEVGWIDYGGKHHESKFTGFFQSYILTRKFNIDKRKLHFSALIRSNQMTRSDAINEIQKDPYDGGEETIKYCLKKLDLSEEDFGVIMKDEVKHFYDYNTYFGLVKKMKTPIKWGTEIGLIPSSVYKKYFGTDF